MPLARISARWPLPQLSRAPGLLPHLLLAATPRELLLLDPRRRGADAGGACTRLSAADGPVAPSAEAGGGGGVLLAVAHGLPAGQLPGLLAWAALTPPPEPPRPAEEGSPLAAPQPQRPHAPQDGAGALAGGGAGGGAYGSADDGAWAVASQAPPAWAASQPGAGGAPPASQAAEFDPGAALSERPSQLGSQAEAGPGGGRSEAPGLQGRGSAWRLGAGTQASQAEPQGLAEGVAFGPQAPHQPPPPPSRPAACAAPPACDRVALLLLAGNEASGAVVVRRGGAAIAVSILDGF